MYSIPYVVLRLLVIAPCIDIVMILGWGWGAFRVFCGRCFMAGREVVEG